MQIMSYAHLHDINMLLNVVSLTYLCPFLTNHNHAWRTYIPSLRYSLSMQHNFIDTTGHIQPKTCLFYIRDGLKGELGRTIVTYVCMHIGENKHMPT